MSVQRGLAKVVSSEVLSGPVNAMTEARCLACGRRLLDYLNAVASGHVVIQKVCERCRTLNVLTLIH